MSESTTSAPSTEDALRAAFELHYEELVRLCLLLTGRPETAEDMAQEAFVRVAPRIGRLESMAVGPYLKRTAVNLWKNDLRRLASDLRARVRMRPLPVRHESADARLDIRAAIRRLPSRQRACVVLRYYCDLSFREVAETMGCSVGTVKAQVSRAMTRLGKELNDEH